MTYFRGIYHRELNELVGNLDWLENWCRMLGGKLLAIRTSMADGQWYKLEDWADLYIAQELIDSARYNLAMMKHYLDNPSQEALPGEDIDALTDFVEHGWRKQLAVWNGAYQLLEHVRQGIEEMTAEM